MQKSDSADNGQARVSEMEKGWLAGLIDGEGCLHIDLDPRGGAHPYLTVTNTNQLIIEKAVDIWQRLGIGCRVQTRSSGGRNPVKDVQVIGYKRLKPALISIMPYLVGKADEALLLYRFVESRLLRFNNHSINTERKYNREELQLIQALKNQKSHNRVLTDYTPNCNAEDIVGAIRRRVEVARNEQPRLISE